ncbi:MAG: hypothetical protein NTU41_09825 [Chloroflexi bacterium]|nr:hypothetical protein [Chloroflexota bacterium]
MLTLFAVPKPFRGHIGVVQTNAIGSWLQLRPRCEVILFGNEEGIAKVAADFGVRHVPTIERNEHGTPLLDDVFSKAQAMAKYDIVCYVNADIIFMSDFVKAVEAVSPARSFLMVGSRWNIDLDEPWDFSAPDWEHQLQTRICQTGEQTPPEWIDYFVFPRGLYRGLLPFALGRAAFDNWLLWKARSTRALLIDASRTVMAVHQNHDYSHHPQGKNGVWEGTEAQRNRQLMGGFGHCFIISDATHQLTHRGLRRNLSCKRFRGYLRRTRIRIEDYALGRTYSWRRRVWLYKWWN